MTHLITATSGRWAPDTIRRPHEWTAAALCRSAGADPEMWFSDPGDAREEAVAACAVCPVRRPCLEVALAVTEASPDTSGGRNTGGAGRRRDGRRQPVSNARQHRAPHTRYGAGKESDAIRSRRAQPWPARTSQARRAQPGASRGG
jgi:hypothetical protein